MAREANRSTSDWSHGVRLIVSVASSGSAVLSTRLSARSTLTRSNGPAAIESSPLPPGGDGSPWVAVPPGPGLTDTSACHANRLSQARTCEGGVIGTTDAG